MKQEKHNPDHKLITTTQLTPKGFVELDGENDKAAIQQYIQGIVSGTINNPAESVSTYINQG